MARVVSVTKTKKAKKETLDNGTEVYGPYKGSKQNNGRPVSPSRTGKGAPAKKSQNTAAYNKMKSTGKPGAKVPAGQHVAHKSGTNKGGNKTTNPSKTRIESKAKNIGDGNRSR